MVTDVPSRPPEADGEAELQRAHVVPVSHGDEEHVSGLQHAVQVRGLGELREAAQVWVLHLHLRQTHTHTDVGRAARF